MSRFILLTFAFVALILSASLNAQITIVNIPVQPFHVTPEDLLNASIMNSEGEKEVQIITQLFSSNNTALLVVRSQPFLLKQGLNAGAFSKRNVASVEYGASAQTAYLKNTQTLPSGRYKVCCSIFISQDGYKTDEFCEDLDGEINDNLYLVNPFNDDTLDSKYPVLSWMHSEPFSILGQGESFRLVVSEIINSQSPEEAISVNLPVMVKNLVQEHQVPYPYDARELKAGSQYAWQVQKIADGVVVNKTEAWKFNMRPPEQSMESKYVSLKDRLDGSFYTAHNGIAYFKFFEEYKNQGKLTYRLTDSKSLPLDLQVKNDAESAGKDVKTKTSSVAMLKSVGNNLFALDFNQKKLGSGFYVLEVKNEKNETFYLKIFLP